MKLDRIANLDTGNLGIRNHHRNAGMTLSVGVFIDTVELIEVILRTVFLLTSLVANTDNIYNLLHSFFLLCSALYRNMIKQQNYCYCCTRPTLTTGTLFCAS